MADIHSPGGLLGFTIEERAWCERPPRFVPTPGFVASPVVFLRWCDECLERDVFASGVEGRDIVLVDDKWLCKRCSEGRDG